jgi:hypothetical protein
MVKGNLPVGVDHEEVKWNRYLDESSVAVTGMDQVGDFLVYTTANRQILKMRILKEKTEDFGKTSYLTIPFHKDKISAVALCLKQ